MQCDPEIILIKFGVIKMSQKTKMQQTTDLGSDWWNDSNDHLELKMDALTLNRLVNQ